jgi:hypothetical protein
VSILIAILQLLPAIIGAVQSIEAAVPIPAAGKAKLDLVLGTVTDVYNTEQAIQKQLPSDKLVPLVTGAITRVVTSFNALGVFKKSA